MLRGPQGTLYGRGATAGAINMVTAKPGKELGGYLSVTAGNYGLAQFKGAIDVPMGDALSMRLAGSLDSRDGYGNNIFTGQTSMIGMPVPTAQRSSMTLVGP
ncbi:MAG: hypothetical protein CM15mP125_4310 [Gammaproteobacteria bacterium]|nr:MAG: hypothetical protein CM15mP125_4310 [Gammaproteobacteria bacterium]